MAWVFSCARNHTQHGPLSYPVKCYCYLLCQSKPIKHHRNCQQSGNDQIKHKKGNYVNEDKLYVSANDLSLFQCFFVPRKSVEFIFFF